MNARQAKLIRRTARDLVRDAMREEGIPDSTPINPTVLEVVVHRLKSNWATGKPQPEHEGNRVVRSPNPPDERTPR